MLFQSYLYQVGRPTVWMLGDMGVAEVLHGSVWSPTGIHTGSSSLPNLY